MRVVYTRLLAASSVAALVLACHDGLAVSPADVAGSYELRSVMGAIGAYETPVSGRITLNISGQAERRVSYQIDAVGTLREVVGRGTYRLTDSLVELTLHEDVGDGAYVWRVQAKLLPDGALRLTYPRPADGTIVEVYQRY